MASAAGQRQLRSKTVKKVLFEVPEWSDGSVYNTCIVDSFLSTLLSAQWRDGRFSSLLIGTDDFTKACKRFLDGEDGVEERKMEFINKLFVPDEHGEFNLEGDEVSTIIDRAPRAIEFSLKSICSSCGKEASSMKNYLYTGKDVPADAADPASLLNAALLRTDRRHRCPPSCKRTAEHDMNVELEVLDTTWMLPFDLSQVGLKAAMIKKLPHTIEVGGGAFRLTGVSLFADAHYTAVLNDGQDWLHYDGISTPALVVLNNMERLKVDKSTVIKIAYYLRAPQ